MRPKTADDNSQVAYSHFRSTKLKNQTGSIIENATLLPPTAKDGWVGEGSNQNGSQQRGTGVPNSNQKQEEAFVLELSDVDDENGEISNLKA